jgi:hypothetical protein
MYHSVLIYFIVCHNSQSKFCFLLLQIFPDYKFDRILVEFEKSMSMELGECINVPLL